MKDVWVIPGLIDVNKSHLPLAVSLIIILSSVPIAYAMFLTPVEIIDSAGDGSGNTLSFPFDVATDSSGNVFVTGRSSDNAFKITPGDTITEIIDSAGDGSGNTLSLPLSVATDSPGNVFVAGFFSNNVFKIELKPGPPEDPGPTEDPQPPEEPGPPETPGPPPGTGRP